MAVPRDILGLLTAVNAAAGQDVSLAALARLAHRSPSDLHRRFRRAVGETPKAYTTRVRVQRAAAELLSTRHPIALVAARHGFASHAVFIRAFTRTIGVPPRAYRRRAPRPGDAAQTAAHAVTVTAVAPCVGLYRTMSTSQEAAAMPVEIVVTRTPAVHALVMRERVARDDVAAALGRMLPALFAHATSHGLAMSGPPFARYPEMSMGTLVVEGGVPLATPADGDLPDGMQALTIPAGESAVAVHQGPYDGLAAVYQELESWLDRAGRAAAGPPRETYLTDPGENPDPETWLTEIAQPLQPTG